MSKANMTQKLQEIDLEKLCIIESGELVEILERKPFERVINFKEVPFGELVNENFKFKGFDYYGYNGFGRLGGLKRDEKGREYGVYVPLKYKLEEMMGF